MEWTVVIAGWIICGFIGAIVGSARQAAGAGFVLGLIFGPLGIIAAFAIDGRRKCPHCAGRLNAGGSVCPACHASVPPEAELTRATTADLDAELRSLDRRRNVRRPMPPRE